MYWSWVPIPSAVGIFFLPHMPNGASCMQGGIQRTHTAMACSMQEASQESSSCTAAARHASEVVQSRMCRTILGVLAIFLPAAPEPKHARGHAKRACMITYKCLGPWVHKQDGYDSHTENMMATVNHGQTRRQGALRAMQTGHMVHMHVHMPRLSTAAAACHKRTPKKPERLYKEDSYVTIGLPSLT